VASTEDLYESVAGGVVLRVHAQPRARRSAVAGRHGDALKVVVSAPPDRGRANEAILDLLARELDVPRRSVSLAGGASSRTKRVLIDGVDAAVFGTTLARLLGE
jgi:uncharacterized protein